MSIQNVFFVDSEMVPLFPTFDEVPEALKLQFLKRFDRQIYSDEGMSPEEYWKEKAALYAEFGKIVCITVGTLHGETFYLKRIYGTDERDILVKFFEAISKAKRVCGHNLKEFDGPYIFRRSIINNVVMSPLINTIGLKPWEVAQDDTMEIWGSTQWKYFISLDFLCEILGVESPKGLMTGADVAGIYYQAVNAETVEQAEELLVRIANYCAGDVVAAARVYCKLKGLPVDLSEEKIKYV